jgi:tetratricopeptide (TPR) repeat protein
MKNLIRSLTLAAFALSAFALPAFAQTTPAAPAASPAAAANPCEEAARGEMYTKYYELKKKEDAKGQPDPAAQKEAYGIGQEYLAKYASCNDSYSKAVQKFVTQYGDAVRKVGNVAELNDALYVKKDFAKAFQVGNQMLAADPENLSLLIQLGYAGYNAQSLNPPVTTFSPTSLGYAKKAVEMLEAGKTPSEWVLFKTKDEALGYLNFAIGEYMRKDNPAGALPYYLKSASVAPTKDVALTYARIAESYERGQYEQLKKDFAARFEGKPETDESKYALNNLNEVIDRVMDAYARAISLAGSDPKFQQLKNESMQILTGYYKFRNNNTTTGLDAFIAGATAKPLPEPFTPQPFVPPATPAPATGSTGTEGGNGAMTTGATTTAAPAATTTTQPAATTQNTTAAKPKPATKKP